MDLTALKDVGNLPFATLTAGMLWQILGPSARYLGGKGQELTQSAVENIERIFTDAHRKLPPEARESGEVPPRVLRAVINEGAFIENEVAASYLGGVLASSKMDCPRDDRGVVINSMISRLSVFQIRLHYVTYMALHYLLQGTESHLTDNSNILEKIHFGTTGLMIAMGFDEIEFSDPEFDLDSAMSHALYGLHREELIGDWEFSWKEGYKSCPTPIGVELFLWASGKGRKQLEYFYNPEFVPNEHEGILILPGRELEIMLDNDQQVTVQGFDYALRDIGRSHSCPLRMNEENRTNN